MTFYVFIPDHGAYKHYNFALFLYIFILFPKKILLWLLYIVAFLWRRFSAKVATLTPDTIFKHCVVCFLNRNAIKLENVSNFMESKVKEKMKIGGFLRCNSFLVLCTYL